MSFRYTLHLQCDNKMCSGNRNGRTYELDTTVYTSHYASKVTAIEAEAEGWLFEHLKCFCPKCAKLERCPKCGSSGRLKTYAFRDGMSPNEIIICGSCSATLAEATPLPVEKIKCPTCRCKIAKGAVCACCADTDAFYPPYPESEKPPSIP